MIYKNKLARAFLFCALSFGGAATMLAPAPAVAQEEEGERRTRRSETLDPAVAKVLQEVFTAMSEERWTDAKAQINQLIQQRGDRMKPFDTGTTYELLGSIEVNLENYPGALRAFQTALNSNGLPPERNNQIRYFVAQIQFQLERYQDAIRGLNEWIRLARAAGQPIDANAYYLLAAAYVQLTPPNYRAAMPNAERVIELRSGDQKKSDYDLLNLIYSELSENTKRSNLLERMINIWPNERSYWTQLAGLYSNTGKDQQAFSVLEVAYRAGLLEKEGEILTLVNYYSFFDNPYRGAKLLQRELDAGRVKRTQANLVLLSQLFSQSREHKRAIPVLNEAARASSKGELSYRLGQVLLADEQYAAAERALESALNKGGMNQRQTGDAWMLLGTARFSQAGPGDRGKRAEARTAFRNATRYDSSRRQASDWVRYIDAINTTEMLQDKREIEQRKIAIRDNIERLTTQAQVCRLQGGDNCEGILEQIESQKSELEDLEGGGDAEEQSASENAADSDSEEAAAEEATPAE